MKTGVYVIEHLASEKKYVGSAAKSISQRWHVHRCSLRKGTHHSVLLQRAWNKYGEDAFVFRIIEPCLPEYATGVEQVFIDWYKSTDPEFGYNICPVAGSSRGTKASVESKAKMSAAQKLRPPASDETRANRSAALKGRKHTDEHRANNSAAHMGQKASAEARAKMSAAMMGDKRNLGRKHTDETRAKIAAAGMGNKYLLGHKHTAETRAKMSAATKGRKRKPLSAEHRAKLSATAKAWHAAKRALATA